MSTPTPPPGDNQGGNPNPPVPPAGGPPPPPAPPPPPPPGGTPPPPPPPPPGAYPGPGGAPQQKTNGLSVASLVLALIGIIPCCGIGIIAGIIAIILGVIGNNQIKQTGEKGEGMAKAGIIIGAIVVVLGILWLILGVANYNFNSYR